MGAETGEETVTFSAFGIKGLLDNNIDGSHIINYGSINDPIFKINITEQVGSIRLISDNGENPHLLENYDSLEKSYKITEEFFRSKNPGYKSMYDVENDIIQGYDLLRKIIKSNCSGMYPVSGYKTSDGRTVPEHMRRCWKHGK